MKNFDRSKYQGTVIASIKKTQDDAKKNSKNFNTGGDGDYVNFFKVEAGNNILRVAPAHDTKDSPYVPVRTAMLKCKVEKRDADYKPTGEFEVKLKKIFISTFHSGKDEFGKPLIPKDVIETYIGYVIRQAEEKHTRGSEDFKKYLNPINGYRAGGKWVSGIKPSTEFVCYGWNSSHELVKAGLFEKWMKDMNEASLKESGDDVFALDIFSDPNTGFPLCISKTTDDKNKTTYKVEVERPARGESWEAFFQRTNPTDEQLMKFGDVKSLKDTYYNVYSTKDFNFAIDGLKRFDEENGYGIFANDEFMDEVEEIAALVPEKKEEESKAETKPEPKPAAKAVVTATTPIAMKKFLKSYIIENYGDEYKLPAISGEELKKWYELAQANDELPFPTSEEVAENEIEDDAIYSETEETSDEAESTEPEPTPAKEPEKQEGMTPADRIAKLKALKERQQQGK
jgi:hypothetical protein